MNDSSALQPIFFRKVEKEKNGVKQVQMIRSSFKELRKRHP